MLIRIAASFLLVSAALSASAQSSPSSFRIYGAADHDTPTPTHSTKTGSDPGALQQFVEFVKASGVAGWKGMTAQGTISYSGGTQSFPARLYLRDSTATRLDVDRSDGTDSIILSGNLGVFRGSDKKRFPFSSDFAQLGIATFSRILSPDYPTINSILTDRGIVAIGGASLHRISLDDPATDVTGSAWKTIDLYFDPTTNYLSKSTSFLRLSSADAALYMVSISYEDYRKDGIAILPHRIVYSLNGNVNWTLQLDTIDLSSIPALSSFSF